MFDIIFISILVGIMIGVGAFVFLFVRIVKVTWTDKNSIPVGSYIIHRNVLLSMQDEIIKGDFLKIESFKSKHTGRLLLIKF